MNEVRAIRQAIIEALPLKTSNDGEAPDRRLVYVPPAHIKALRLECNLVIGARGVGKSFWTAALASAPLRTALGQSVRELEAADVHIGFSVATNLNDYPDSETFSQLINNGSTPFDIWRSVIVRWLANILSETIPADSWADTASWVKGNPEPLARFAQNANRQLQDSARYGLIVFDALDRTSNDWETMDTIVRDLLRAVLWLKAYPRLHAKVFLREDQFDRTITDFPDASKLLNTKAELTWAPHDLHGLLWQMFCNAQNEHGECLRSIYSQVVGTSPVNDDGVWLLGDEIKRETVKQRTLFEELAGPWMGRDHRRGVPYVWSVSHLADGNQRTSPRSFLAAILAAAENSSEKYPEHIYALHYESIKKGVQKASEIRENEMSEEYPWVSKIMAPLHGLTVPCDFSLIEGRWAEKFPDGLEAAQLQRLPPQHADRWPGIRDDLGRLGIFETMKDGRVNLPDLYRVGFGLGRRGGVKPIK